jgi:broad specificity phosphatase PhoE
VGAVTAIWSSDLQRARRTAELLAGSKRLPRLDARLRERHVGAWTGLTRDAIDARYPGWIDADRRPDGWEDDDTVRRRGMPALWDAVGASSPSSLVIAVTHGGFIRAVVTGLGGDSWPIPNLGGVWLERDGDHLTLGPRVALLAGGDDSGLDLVGGPTVD